MTYIAPNFPALIQALQSQGFSYLEFRRSPFKCKGMWRCEMEVKPCA